MYLFATLLTELNARIDWGSCFCFLIVVLLFSNIFLLNFSKTDTLPLFQFKVHLCLHTHNICPKISLLDCIQLRGKRPTKYRGTVEA